MAPDQSRTVVDLRQRRPGAPEPLWREAVGLALRRERRSQGRTLRQVAESARISLPYLSEVERGRKEASSEILAAAAAALGLSLLDLLRLVHRELAPAPARMTPAHPVTTLTRAPSSPAAPALGFAPAGGVRGGVVTSRAGAA